LLSNLTGEADQQFYPASAILEKDGGIQLTSPNVKIRLPFGIASPTRLYQTCLIQINYPYFRFGQITDRY